MVIQVAPCWQRLKATFLLGKNMNTIDSTTAKIVNQLFEEIFSIRPAFIQAFTPDIPMVSCKRQWVLAFQDAKINTMEKLQSGLKKMRLNPTPFFPSPGQFIEMCKSTPEDIHAPSLDAAYSEACQKYHPCYGPDKNWSHPAVKHAAEKYGSQIHVGSIKETRHKFEKIYLDSCQQYADGNIMQQIENKRHVPVSEVRKEHKIGKYEFSRDGVLKMYEGVQTHEECMAICSHLLGQGNEQLKRIIANMEKALS